MFAYTLAIVKCLRDMFGLFRRFVSGAIYDIVIWLQWKCFKKKNWIIFSFRLFCHHSQWRKGSFQFKSKLVNMCCFAVLTFGVDKCLTAWRWFIHETLLSIFSCQMLYNLCFTLTFNSNKGFDTYCFTIKRKFVVSNDINKI